MATSYATYAEYILATGDAASSQEQVKLVLEDLSAELRAECGISDSRTLAGDAAILARKCVVDAARKMLVRPAIDGFAGDMTNARQASFTANGITESVTLSTASAWFDSRSLARLKRLVGRGQRVGMVYPYGW
ncbi:MAG: hypothetical protein IKG21_13185 [Atopobiaceae bacterium]|nr:hypothetical protein [Atopobiaceae bacterium]